MLVKVFGGHTDSKALHRRPLFPQPLRRPPLHPVRFGREVLVASLSLSLW